MKEMYSWKEKNAFSWCKFVNVKKKCAEGVWFICISLCHLKSSNTKKMLYSGKKLSNSLGSHIYLCCG